MIPLGNIGFCWIWCWNNNWCIIINNNNNNCRWKQMQHRNEKKNKIKNEFFTIHSLEKILVLFHFSLLPRNKDFTPKKKNSIRIQQHLYILYHRIVVFCILLNWSSLSSFCFILFLPILFGKKGNKFYTKWKNVLCVYVCVCALASMQQNSVKRNGFFSYLFIRKET